MIRPIVLCLLVVQFALPVWSQEPPANPAEGLLLQGTIKLDDSVRELPKVGKLGRPDALVFTGVNAFPESQLRDALARDFDVLLARDSQAKLAEYLEVLERRLSEGYRKSGFPHVKITLAADSAKEQIQIAVSEGEAFKTGQVKVDGSDAINEAVMARFLTETAAYPSKTLEKKPGPSDSAPTLWKSGQPADFYQQPVKTYEKAIQAGFAAQGYFFPEFDAEIKPGDNSQADLWIHVKETGAKATIGEITVEGNGHHAAEQILKLLDIKSGLTVDNQRSSAWEQRLLATHCFLEAKVFVMPTIAPELPSDLLIRVVEQPNGPYLGESLTAQDKLFMKLAHWLAKWHEGEDGDCVMCFRKGPDDLRLFLVIAPKKGIAADIEFNVPYAPQRFRYTVIMMDGRLRVVSWARKQMLLIDSINLQIAFSMLFGFSEKPTVETRFKCHTGMPALHVAFEITPATAIAWRRASPKPSEIQNGVVKLANETTAIQIDAESGRIIAVSDVNNKLQLEDVKKSLIPELQKQDFFLYFHSGAFDRFLSQLDHETKAFQQSLNPQRPVSSVLEFVFGELECVLDLAIQDIQVGVLIRLLQLDAIKPLDQLWVETHSRSEKQASFDLPMSSQDNVKFFGLENKVPFGLGQQLGRIVFNVHGLLVPPESGPGRVGWNLALLCAGRSGDAIANLDRLAEAPEVGPLSCWYASRAFGLLNPGWGQTFAGEGLKKLEPNQFRYEIDQLLPAESLLFELVESFGNAVRQLDDDEFAQLSLLLGEEAKNPAVPKLIETLRQEKGTPSRTLVLDSLVTLWTIRGQAECRKQLEKLAGPTPDVSNPANYNDLNLDSLFPEEKSKKDTPKDESLETKFKLLGGEQIK